MFHKLLDVFLSAIIFILGIVLFFVILNYALGYISYNLISPSPYPFNQMSQVRLFERDYKISILNEKLPYQNSPGFDEPGSSGWVKSTTYFGTSNMVGGHKEGKVQAYSVSLQRYNHGFSDGGQPMPPTSIPTGYNPFGNPLEFPKNFIYDFGWYLLEGDSQVSGYMLALYRPSIYPYTIKIDNNNLAILDMLGLISPSTVLVFNGDVSNKTTAMYLGAMQYRYSPLPYIGYHSTGDVFSPSLIIIGTNYNNKFLMMRQVSFVRNEIGSIDSEYPVYLYYDSSDKKWKPMVFGSVDGESVKIVSPVQASFYSVQMGYKLITVQNVIGGRTPDNYFNLHKDKLVDSYYVVGNPVMTVDENGNLVPYPTTVLYKIVSFSLPVETEPSFKYQVPVLKSFNSANDAKDFIDRLNSINAH